jgi:integrase
LDILIQHYENGLEAPPEIKRWLQELGDERYAQFLEHGLVGKQRRQQVNFLAFVKDYFARRARNNKSPDSTRKVWDRAVRWTTNYWQTDFPLQSLTGQQCSDFRGFLLQQKGRGNATWTDASASKICSCVSQALNAAVKEGLIDKNPLRGWAKTSVGANPDTWEYVSTATIRRLMDASTCPEERLLLGLSRLAALRIPSEIRTLKWSDLTIEGEVGLLKVRTPKTTKNGKHEKDVPVCGELLRLMLEARKSSVSEFMLPRLRSHSNPQMVFGRLCDKAGVARWKRITHQLRASCLSDWMAHYSVVEVSHWAGNSPKILLTHYARPQKAAASVFAAARLFSAGQAGPSACLSPAVTAPVTAEPAKTAA